MQAALLVAGPTSMMSVHSCVRVRAACNCCCNAWVVAGPSGGGTAGRRASLLMALQHNVTAAQWIPSDHLQYQSCWVVDIIATQLHAGAISTACNLHSPLSQQPQLGPAAAHASMPSRPATAGMA